MKPFQNIFLFLSALICPLPVLPLQRNLTSSKAPGCEGMYCEFNMFYIRADGPQDSLHYIWDFTEKPSLCLISTKLNNTLVVDWAKYANKSTDSVIFTSPVEYIIIVVLDKFVQFEDVNDTGLISNSSNTNYYESNNFQWIPQETFNSTNDLHKAAVSVRGTYLSKGTLSGYVNIELEAYSVMDHDEWLPRLLHSANSSQITLKLKDLITTNSSLLNSRWAVELLVVSSDMRNESLDIESRRSLDDEYSPGDFKVINVVTPHVEILGANLQWRPVVYTTDISSISNSSEAAVMDPIIRPVKDINGTFASKVKDLTSRLDNVLIQSIIVSFGSSQDGFYKKTNYSSWTFLINYGHPQIEGFSMLIIFIMSIGLGLPAVLIFIGGIFLLFRRISHRTDELSLER